MIEPHAARNSYRLSPSQQWHSGPGTAARPRYPSTDTERRRWRAELLAAVPVVAA